MADLNGLEVQIKPINKVKYENGIFSIKIDPNNFYSEKGMKKEDLEKYIENFVANKIKKCKYFDVRNFMNRMRNVLILHFKPKEGDLYAGDYSYEFGIIRFDTYDTLDHELEHVSKQKPKKDNITRAGLSFCIGDDDYIGEGIDEGNTEILKERYTGKPYSQAYFFETLVHKHFENLLSSDAVEKASYDAEYIDILMELSDYLSVDETLLLLDNLDYLTWASIFEKENIDRKEYLFCKKCVEYMSYCLQKAYLKKLSTEHVSSKDFKKYINRNLWLVGVVAIVSTRKGNDLKAIYFTNDKEYNEFKEKAKILKAKGINQ